jgi:hypothetical protein
VRDWRFFAFPSRIQQLRYAMLAENGHDAVPKQAAESLSTADYSTAACCGRGREQYDVSFPLVIALDVETRNELGQRPSERAFTEHDEFGKAFLFHRSHPSLRESIQIWASRR